MWKRFLKFLRRDRLVKSFVWQTTLTSRGSPDRVGKLYIHCFESRHGLRRIELETSFPDPGSLMYLIKQWSVYHETVYPWLNYGVEPAIPKYSDRNNDEVIGDVNDMNLESLLKK